jgi:hypothetical protein
MRSEFARTVSTIAIWGAIASILITLRIRGPENVVVSVMVGMTGFLSVAAALGTFAIWRAPQPAEFPKYVHRDL